MATDGVGTLNSLLRGELAATETYQQALAKVGNDPKAAELRRIHVEHRTAANTLRQHIHGHGGKPDQDSGVWGAFAKAIEGAATIFGNKAALKALKEGEERGIKDYDEGVTDRASGGRESAGSATRPSLNRRTHVRRSPDFISAQRS